MHWREVFVGILCSSIYYSEFAQYYRLVFVEFVGSSLKTFSSVIYFFISFNRYFLLEKENKLGLFISKKTKRLLIIFFSLIIIGLNSHKLILHKVISISVFNILQAFSPDLFFHFRIAYLTRKLTTRIIRIRTRIKIE